ncbi:polycystic kidney disease and receptor for egg jelly-related protein-like [Pteropus medius]|uniref:polycystic kidney disease and receptor for egg jelly-related protein-like n=1 Tax=Pteropus vampyrus TaxID=132908 RepID=UPI00196A60E8|nr:polycystic kidney disease and receptor for egg jelly-related protein-like [Pteropus giganteus]
MIEITPDVAEVYLGRKNLSFAAFSLIMGPDNEPSEDDEYLTKTAGGFSFEVDSEAGKEVLVHILTEVTVPFTVLVYAGSHVTPTALVATFLVPHDIPPIANQSDLFDPACTVKVARVVCLPPSLLKAIAQRSQSTECAIAVVLKAPRFVTKRSDKVVRISLFYVHCLDMFGIQSDWREDICVLGEMTTWDRVHCVCKNTRRARRQLNTIGQANIPLHARYLTAKVIVVPNPIDLGLEVIKEVTYNLVTVITVLFIMLTYILLAFWTLHRDKIDQYLRDHAIVLRDNDPYDHSRDRATLDEVSPQKHAMMLVESEYWEERLEKWHAHETAEALTGEAEKLPPKESPGLRKSPSKAASKRGRQLKKAESKVSLAKANTNTNANNKTSKENEGVESAEPSSQPGPPPLPTKPSIVLPRWCVYVAWFLVFATCSVSSFLIAFYGLTYSYEMAIEWLFASFCSFFLSVFLVEPTKIILLSAIRLHKLKYCKNLPWVNHYRYTEITLENMRLNPDEKRKQHDYIVSLRGTRMYQPLTEDEIRIFKRKKRLKRRALLFLIFVLTHFIFLALLLWLVALLRHTDTFYYNQFLRNRFSVDLATVTRLQDIYSWLNDVLVPLLHNSLNPTFLPESASIILGLPLMRQVRAKSGAKACLPAKNFAQTSIKGEIHCHPKYGADPEDTQNYTSSWIKISKRATDKNTKGFTYKPKEKRWPYHSHGLLHTYGSGGYAFYFFPDQEQFNSTERLKGLRSSKWLDEKTWAVILELTTLNPDANLFCSLSVVFEVSPLGVVNTSLSVHSFALADFNRKTMAEIFLYAAILIFFLAYVAHEGYVITQERASYVKSVYNLLNFALICVFAVLIVLLLRKHVLAAGLIQLHSSNSAEFIPFHAVSQVDHAMRVTLGFLLFLTILKTLRYSRIFYDVRLAQGAIQTALPGIFHMALLMSIYFFVYMAFGCLVFGQHEWNYSTLMRATQTIFSYCVSAFQNTEFSENRVLGILFLSSFVLLMICILINLLRAVILLAYKKMKQPVYEEPSEEVEAMTYLCGKLRTLFGFLSFRSKAKEKPKLFVDMLYGQPEKNNRRYLGLKTRNINERKMVYLVV